MNAIAQQKLLLILIANLIGSVSLAAGYVTVVGSKINADYKTVTSGTGEATNTTGDIELIGFGGGITTQAPGAAGVSVELLVLGTNAQKLVPPPSWGVPWYFRLAAKGNYTFSFGLYLEAGGDIISSFYQSAESHYLGVGVNLGLGYRFNEAVRACLSMENSSVLFANDNGRVWRGTIFQLIYAF